MAKQGLTIKQEKYAQNLFAGMSQREAYRKAYDCKNMTYKTIDEDACRLANDSKVIARLNELTCKVEEKSLITKEYVLNNLKTIAERCMQAEPVLDKEGTLFEFKFDANGANKSLELLGKHLKLFTDKVETSGTLDVTIHTDEQERAILALATPEQKQKMDEGLAVWGELAKLYESKIKA